MPEMTEASEKTESMHIIRLRGPWQFEVLACLDPGGKCSVPSGIDSLPRSGQIRVPADLREWLAERVRGPICFQRRFHRPSGLGAGTRVWLVVNEVIGKAAVVLNECLLSRVEGTQYAITAEEVSSVARFDITALLKLQNLLAITVTPALNIVKQAAAENGQAENFGRFLEQVWLEIRE